VNTQGIKSLAVAYAMLPRADVHAPLDLGERTAPSPLAHGKGFRSAKRARARSSDLRWTFGRWSSTRTSCVATFALEIVLMCGATGKLALGTAHNLWAPGTVSPARLFVEARVLLRSQCS